MLNHEFNRLKDRFIWSLEGWRDSWRNQKSLRQWVWANLASALMTFIIPMGTAERALVIGFGLLVLVAELFNSAIETVVDDISTDIRPLAKRAKDTASAAVMVTAIATGVIWLLILLG